MAADFSRVRLNALLDFAGIELKQGAVLLDADANELVAILDRRLRALASDTLGRAAVARSTPDAFKVSAGAGTLQIGKGRMYVDGLLAENHGAPGAAGFDPLLAEPVFGAGVDYHAQPYLPFPPPLPAAGRHLVYLDVWNRELTHLEHPALVEIGVGVETSSRLQTVWQVRVLMPDAAGALCATPDAELPGWSELSAPSSGVLSSGALDLAPSGDPCELPPTGRYRGLENQLYRVEIHDPGQPGAAATFKWSRENASVGSRVASMISGTMLELDTLGRDEVLRINSGDWVEIVDDVRELSQAAGEMRRVSVDEAARRISFAQSLPDSMLPTRFPDAHFPQARNLRVRRWDQKGAVFRVDPGGEPVQVQDLDAPDTQGLIRVPAAGTTLLLENGVTVRFDSTGPKGFKAGDHWEFAARSADASVEPLERAPPRGIHHHYARLGLWDVPGGDAALADCRIPWPPAVGAAEGCACTLCVTPASHRDGWLTVQGAVDRLQASGGTVCLQAGQYFLANPVRIESARSLRITGQGAATMIGGYGPAFIVTRSTAVVLDEMNAFSLLHHAVISVRTVLGLTLRRLALIALAGTGVRGAAISLSGAVLGATIDNNLIIAQDGIRALEPPQEGVPDHLLTAVLRIDNNLFWCGSSAVRLSGRVGHALETRVTGNQIIGCQDVGLALEGFTLPRASVRVSDNHLDLHGAGIRSAGDGALIEGNDMQARRLPNRRLRGAGIELVAGLDRGGVEQCQILANQLSGFPDAGIRIDAPVQTLMIKLNQIARCGSGILMTAAASAAALAIENNQLRDLSLRAAGGSAVMSAGIAIFRVASATVGGNTIGALGVDAGGATELVAGIAAFAVQRVRITANTLLGLGPPEDIGGIVAGIVVRAPYAHADLGHNHAAREAQLNYQGSSTRWYALRIDDLPGGAALRRLARHTALRLDDGRTLVIFGERAYVEPAPGGFDAHGAPMPWPGASAAVQGNVFHARGSAPAVDIGAGGDILFNGNHCELHGKVDTAVILSTPVAVIHANCVRGGDPVSIRVLPENALVAAIGNITTGAIHPPLPFPMEQLNLRR